MTRGPFFSVLVLSAVLTLACSGSSSSPVMPDTSAPGLTSGRAMSAHGGTSKAVWGIWQVTVDTATWEVSIVPLRSVEYTVDVVMFLQPPVGDPSNLTIQVTDVTEWFTQGLIDVDVGLRHPFPGLDMYTGFDVYGAFMAPGTVAGQYDSDVSYTNGDDESIVLNADGYTRWMNPVEFIEDGTILNFITGKLGTQDIGLFTSTINGYKYFADGLEKDESVGVFFSDPLNAGKRGLFSSTGSNRREYELKFPMVGGSPSLIFQYAVVASWVEPDEALSGDPDVLDIPGDFAPNANADEAIYLGITDNSTLYYVDGSGGGAISLELEVYDWGALQDGVEVVDEIYQIIVEGSPSLIPGGYAVSDQTSLAASVAPGSSIISSVFEVEIPNCTPQSLDDVPILITVESFAPETFDPGIGIPANDDRLAAYFRYNAPVGDEIPSMIQVIDPNGAETLWMAMSHEITWDPGPGTVTDVKIEWSTDNFVSDIRTIIDSTENNGSYEWKPIPVEETDTARIRISDVLGIGSDTSDGDFTIALPVWLDFQPEMPVDDSTVSWAGWPGYVHSYQASSPAIVQDIYGMVHVHFSHNVYGDSDNVHFRSMTGTSWNGTGNFFGIGGGNGDMLFDCAKAAPSHTVGSWAGLCHKWGYFRCSDINRLMGGNGHYTSDAVRSRYLSGGFSEIATDTDGYIFFFGDNWASNTIYWNKTNQPGLTGNGSGGQVGPVQLLTSDGNVSHSRSWARQGQGVALVFTTNSGEIHLAETTDAPTNNTWDTSEVIFDGSGYSNVTDPALCADSTERLFAIWTGRNSSTSEYEVLASMRETVNGPWTDPVVVFASASYFDDIHISSALVALPTGTDEDVAVVEWWTNDEVGSALSPLDLMAFLPDQDVNETTSQVIDPDVMCIDDSFGYVYDVLFAYAYNNSGNWDCAIRQADFETP